MDQSTHDVRRANWLSIVNQCQSRPSDISVRQWLAENDIKEKAYYYWLRKFRKEAYGQMQLPAAATKTEIAFAEVTMPVPATTIIAKLNQILVGYYHYYGITDNSKSLGAFQYRVEKSLFYWLNRRSQKKSYTWEEFGGLMKQFPLEKPRIYVSIYG